MKLVPTGKRGLMMGVSGTEPPTIDGVRMTIPAKEALEREGHVVYNVNEHVYGVTLKGRRMPRGLVAAFRWLKTNPGYGMTEEIVLRLDVEPPWPGEFTEGNWQTAEWLACPKCGAPVLWYEAGYVPGYRVCTGKRHHHSIVKF